MQLGCGWFVQEKFDLIWRMAKRRNVNILQLIKFMRIRKDRKGV
jgi:hypothetical protein